jgi:hypothetical protein
MLLISRLRMRFCYSYIVEKLEAPQNWLNDLSSIHSNRLCISNPRSIIIQSSPLVASNYLVFMAQIRIPKWLQCFKKATFPSSLARISPGFLWPSEALRRWHPGTLIGLVALKVRISGCRQLESMEVSWMMGIPKLDGLISKIVW